MNYTFTGFTEDTFLFFKELEKNFKIVPIMWKKAASLGIVEN